MKKIVLLLIFFYFFWNYQSEIQEFWKDSKIKEELAFLENFDSNSLEESAQHLKAQLIDLQKNFENKKDQSVEKVLEVKTALEETQKAIQELQDSIAKLQEVGQKVKKSLTTTNTEQDSLNSK